MPPKYVMTLQSLWGILRETFTEWSKDNAMVLGAALAFYTMFSLAPLLIIITVVVGYFLGQAAVQANLLARLSEYVGRENAHNLMNIIQHSYQPGSGLFATVIALFLMLFGASTVFLMLKNALNNMWGVTKPATNFFYLVLDRLKTFVVVMIVGFLLFVSMLLKSLLAYFFQTVSRFLVVPEIVLQISDHVFSLLFISALFAILYKVLPDAKHPGAMPPWCFVTVLLFSIGSYSCWPHPDPPEVSARPTAPPVPCWSSSCGCPPSSLIIFLGAQLTEVYARLHG